MNEQKNYRLNNMSFYDEVKVLKGRQADIMKLYLCCSK